MSGVKLNKKFNYEFTILTLGNTHVGKTSIINKYANNEFRLNYITTIGLDRQSKIIEKNDQKIKLTIWDTAGQEKFKSISRQYYKKADGVLLIYEVTSRESYDCIKSWMEEIKSETKENICIVLVGNKNDIPMSKRELSDEDGEKLANSLKITFFSTSAYSGNNINEVFDFLVDQLLINYKNNKNKNLEKNDFNQINSWEKKKKCC